MNNLQILREFTEVSPTVICDTLDLTPTTLFAFESGEQQPTVAQWQALAEFYASRFKVANTGHHQEPIHFRLSVDYLMNLGLTMNDLLAMQWYFLNRRPELGKFGIALFTPGQPQSLERITTDLPTILDEYAGFVLLNPDGTLHQFVDEKNQGHVSDWRLVLYKNDHQYLDVTDTLIDAPDLPNFSQF